MVLIYKNTNNSINVNIDFYEKPAVIELNNEGIITHFTINGDFLDGNKMDFENTLKWLNNCKTKLEDIIWEWQTGNDNFDLIDTRLVL